MNPWVPGAIVEAVSLTKRLWDVARSNITDFSGAFTRRHQDVLDEEHDEGRDGSVGARAGEAARRVKDRAEQAWEHAYEAAQHRRGPAGRGPSPSQLSRWYETLEVTPSTSDDEIRRAYRRLINRYHPDRFAAHPEKLAAATEVARKLTEAYNGIRSHREA